MMTEFHIDAPIHSFSERGDPRYEFQQTLPSDFEESSKVLVCHWNRCLKEYANHAVLSDHLSEDHVGWKKGDYACDWDECSRQGTKCHNRFALMMHLRIHTGEKPFECNYPNCEQTFGRTDALIRHKKTEHNEDSTATWNKAKKGSKRTMKKNKKRKKGHSSGEESEDSIDDTPKQPNPSSKPLIPGSDYSQYRLAKAQLNYILRENQMLQDEYEVTQKKLKRMKTERKVLLEAVMTAEGTNEEQIVLDDL